MSQAAPLKYLCYDPKIRQHVISICDNNEIKNHIQELYELIEYQMIMINDQRRQLIAIEHKKAWVHYEKDQDSKNPNARS